MNNTSRPDARRDDMKQSDELEAAMRQMLAQNAAAAEAVVAGARAEREVAGAERTTARQELLDTQKNSASIYATFLEEHRVLVRNDVWKKCAQTFAENLLKRGVSVEETAELLEVEEGLVADIARMVGYYIIRFDKPKTTVYAWAQFQDEGRGGYLTLHWGRTVSRFWYEIAASPAKTLLEIPVAELWESQTNIPLVHRKRVLEFLGEQLLLRHGRGFSYRIEPDSVVIY
ncbi:MAG: hypothetical protein JNJ90_20025 [Saprospiraceae bacterium]|jgi:hypothetical protein|nr:hypothetical protein [Saprospiraceae bacterium]